MPERINEDSQIKQGYLYAIRLLAASKKSESELLKRLLKKGFSEFSALEVIQKLKQKRILSDQKLVEEAVHWATQTKRYGKRRISMELKRRGIASVEIENAFKNYDDLLERQTAAQLAQERWQKLNKVEMKKRKTRVYNFLLNRGFDFELVREILNQLESKTRENI